MPDYRNSAIAIALLFVVATAASIAAAVLTDPIFASTDLLNAAVENASALKLAVLAMLLASAAIIAIPIVFLPLLRRHNVASAGLYVASRSVEGVLFIVSAMLTLSLLAIGRERGLAPPESSIAFDATGGSLNFLAETGYNLGPGVAFSVSAILLGLILYQTRLVPRWLSAWKAIGGVLFLIQGILILFEAATPILEATLYLPIAVNEMVFALWLLIKGFDQTAIARLHRLNPV